MSKYTTELRYIIEQEENHPPLEGSLSLKNVLANYPLYIETYTDVTSGQTINRRVELNQKILEHYYFREIGFETVPRFLFHLKRKMNEIMKLYNQKYKSVDYEFNPLWNVDMSETFEHTIEGTGSTTTNGTNINNGGSTNTNVQSGDNLAVESDTPNTQLSETDIKSNMYASKTTYDKNTNNVTNTETNNNTLTTEGEINQTDNKTESFTRREFGSSKGYTFAQNIEQWRSIMINVDMEVVEELNSLFMNIW